MVTHSISQRLMAAVETVAANSSDSPETRSIKNLLVLLASLMSIGGLVWGVLLFYFGLHIIAIIPLSYVVISGANILNLHARNHLAFAKRVQIFASLILPFCLQWTMGGFFSSGVVMLWSTIALVGSIALFQGRAVYVWLLVYILLTIFSFYLNPYLVPLAPQILTPNISLILMLVNMAMIVSIVFVFSKIKTDYDQRIRRDLAETLQRLAIAKEEAEESNRLKTIFLGNLSHEVRTPLQGIQGMAELLESPSLSANKQLEFLQIIKRRTTDLQSIIESLLDLASIESGEIRPYPSRVNIHELMNSIFQKMKEEQIFATKNIEYNLHNHLEPTEMVTIDPYHLAQVLTNLMSNATKFTDNGSINVSARKMDGQYIIEVADTGIGIDSTSFEHIFKPFRQAHEGLSRSKGGIGLGLAICKKMVELWGGRIQVISTPGEGSVFSITIPQGTPA